MAELNLDTFGEIVDKYLNDSDIYILLHMPEGTQAVEIEKTNLPESGVLYFFAALRMMITSALKMHAELSNTKSNFDWPGFVDSLMDVVKEELLEAVELPDDEEDEPDE